LSSNPSPTKQREKNLSESDFFVTVTNNLRKNSLKEERFILAHSFKGSLFTSSIAMSLWGGRTTWRQDHVVKETAHLKAVKNQNEKGRGQWKTDPSKTGPQLETQPPTKLHLPQVHHLPIV
jgi:hypothetical protein